MRCQQYEAAFTKRPMIGAALMGIRDDEIVPQDRDSELKELLLFLDSISGSCHRDREMVATSINIHSAQWAMRRNAEAWKKVMSQVDTIKLFIAVNPRMPTKKSDPSDALMLQRSNGVEIIQAVEPDELDTKNPMPYLQANW
jgi:hypothetical protein